MKSASKQTPIWIFLTGALALTFVAGCGGNEVNERSLEIQAFIEGTVVDGVTHQPIANATITVPGAEEDLQTIVTDDSGFYRLEVAGVGSHTVFVEAAGHARAKYVVTATTEPGASGNITVTAVRNSQLYPTTGTLNGRVTSGGPRNAVPGADVLVQFLDPTDPIEDASIDVSTVTDADGNFTLDDLPAGSPVTRVTVFSVDLGDGDPEPDTQTVTLAIPGGPGSAGSSSLTPDGQNFIEISVPAFVQDDIISNTVDDNAVIAPDEPLEITFARAMNTTEDATDVTLRVSIAPLDQEVAQNFSWSADATTLTVVPLEPLIPGERYTLSVVARSLEGVVISEQFPFSVESPEAPADAPDDVAILNPTPIPFNVSRVVIGWSAVDNAEGYRIFARNNMRQTSWVKVFDQRVSPFSNPQVNVDMPSSFDSYPEDPLFFGVTGFGTEVQFAVQAFAGNNLGPFPVDTQLATLSDVECPHFVMTLVGGSSADNLSTFPQSLKVLIQSDEPIGDVTARSLAFAFTAAPNLDDTPTGIRRTALDAIEVSFEVPPSTANAPTTLTADVSELTDTSGNQPDGNLCPDELTLDILQ